VLDLLIRGGLVYDGSGGPAFEADVAVHGDVIEAVERLDGAEAVRVIDARGLAVAPGFIDTHTHSDVMLLANPQHAPKLQQGVTTEVLGQDGISYAPLSPRNLEIYRRYVAGLNGIPDILWDWSTVAEFRARFERTVAINTMYLIPHGAIRLEVLGMRDRPLVGADMKRAQALIAQGMEEWAVGFSTGLSYFPQSWSDTDELVELCRPVAKKGGLYVVHLRTVFRGARYDPVWETLEVGRRSGVSIHFSHFRTHPATAGKTDQLLAPIEAAKAEGLDITMESYPYPSGNSTAVMLVPAWAQEDAPEGILECLRDPDRRARIVAEMESTVDPSLGVSFADYVYSYLPSGRNDDIVGLNFLEATKQRGADSPSDLVCDLLLDEGLAVGFLIGPPAPAIWQTLDRDLMRLFARPDYTIGSDSVLAGQKPHPRTYGTFPRLLGRLRREYGGPSLETLINRATGFAAQRFGLRDRGLLRRGKAADLVIFNPETLTDTATYDNPISAPVGIEFVLVNGQLALERGKPTGILAGRTLP